MFADIVHRRFGEGLEAPEAPSENEKGFIEVAGPRIVANFCTPTPRSGNGLQPL